MYHCAKHEMEYEFEPCKVCAREFQMQELKARNPVPSGPVVKEIHIHEPGPCPECIVRRGNERRQRVALLLAVLMAIMAAGAGNLLKLEDPVKTLLYVPPAVIALLGVLVHLREPHEVLEKRNDEYPKCCCDLVPEMCKVHPRAEKRKEGS